MKCRILFNEITLIKNNFYSSDTNYSVEQFESNLKEFIENSNP